jgi:SPP1 gp7 family putative phage head morphogenesis protein
VKVFQGCTKAIHKEFMREYKAAIKLMNSKDAFDKLAAYSKRVHPELYKKEKEKFFSKGSQDDMKEVNKWLSGWDEDVDPEQMAKVLGIWQPKAAKLGGSSALKKLGVTIAFNLKDPAVLKQLSLRGTKIAGDISKRTLNDFRKVLYTSYMEEGLSPYDVRKRIEGLFEETYRNRAMAIARTETGIASSIAQHETYAQNDVQKKEWLATMDDRTRPSHAEANGQIVGIDEPFQVGDAELMHPCDPSGPAEEVINCRCDELPIIETKIKEEDAWTGG